MKPFRLFVNSQLAWGMPEQLPARPAAMRQNDEVPEVTPFKLPRPNSFLVIPAQRRVHFDANDPVSGR